MCVTCGAWAALQLVDVSEDDPADKGKLRDALSVLTGVLEFFDEYAIAIDDVTASKLGLALSASTAFATPGGLARTA